MMCAHLQQRVRFGVCGACFGVDGEITLVRLTSDVAGPGHRTLLPSHVQPGRVPCNLPSLGEEHVNGRERRRR
jgi:hypothetical protein